MRNSQVRSWRAAAVVLSGLVAFLAGTTEASASLVTVNFVGSSCASSVGSLGGFTFSNWVTECDADYQTIWNNTVAKSAPSPSVAAGNDYQNATIPSITRATPFSFLGGMGSSFLVSDAFDTFVSSGTLTINGYLANGLVGTLFLDFESFSPGYVLLSSGVQTFGNFLSVDTLEFLSMTETQGLTYGTGWLADDLQFEVTDTVPEPAGLVLFGGGLALLALTRKRWILRVGKSPRA